jgi:hypothetical protein
VAHHGMRKQKRGLLLMCHLAPVLRASMIERANLQRLPNIHSSFLGQLSRNAHKQALRGHIVACAGGSRSMIIPFVYVCGRHLHCRLAETVHDWAPGQHL